MRALKQNCPGLVKANQRKMDARKKISMPVEIRVSAVRNENGAHTHDFDGAINRRRVRLGDVARPNPKVAKIAEKNRVL